jgi:hypothetical protein
LTPLDSTSSGGLTDNDFVRRSTVLRSEHLVCAALAVGVLWSPSRATAGASAAPNWAPELTFSYVDPVTGEHHECGGDCRRFEVPAGVDLEIRVQVVNLGDNPSGDPVSWDLWFDQPLHPFPGADLAACWEATGHVLDIDCWQAMRDAVDWDWWDALDADRVCVPQDPGDCVDETITVPMQADFDGSRGRGVYTFLVWVDRFGTQSESDEFDNVSGPVRVKAVPAAAVATVKPIGPPVTVRPGMQVAAPASVGTTSRQAVFAPSSPKPFSVHILQAHEEKSFSLSSGVGRASLEFSPSCTGAVTVDVEQIGEWEMMTVEVRKVSTGEVLAEFSGKGRARLEGTIEAAHLKDDREFEVIVQPNQGTRGIRGTIAVSYPDRAVYRRTE